MSTAKKKSKRTRTAAPVMQPEISLGIVPKDIKLEIAGQQLHITMNDTGVVDVVQGFTCPQWPPYPDDDPRHIDGYIATAQDAAARKESRRVNTRQRYLRELSLLEALLATHVANNVDVTNADYLDGFTQVVEDLGYEYS